MQEKRIDKVIAGKEPYIWWQPIVDSMVRDFTQIAPKPKSSVRGRIIGLIQEVESRERERWNNTPEGVSQWRARGEKFGYWDYFANLEREKIIEMIEEIRGYDTDTEWMQGYDKALSVLIQKLKTSNFLGV